MFLHFLKFFIPIGLWLYLFRDLLSGAAPLQTEPFADLAILNFYLTHLRLGIVPLWNPFLFWGFPWEILLTYVGFANPIWLLTVFLNAFGIKFYFAFVYTIVAYFLIGQAGFYFLAHALFKETKTAYIAFLFLLFSSVGLVSLVQLNMLLIFVPAVWFFYFALRWTRRWDITSWLGIVFTLMLVNQAYLPFYFVTLAGLAALFWGIVYARAALNIFIAALQFGKRNIFIVILSLIVLGVTFIPSYFAYRNTATHEVVLPWRQKGMDVWTKGSHFGDYDKTTEGSLSSRMSIDDLYSNVDQLLYANDGFVYLSGFAFLILLLGAFNRLNRRVTFLGLLFLSLFFLSLGNATPVHRFFYEHVFYFKMMRNMHFFLPFFLAVLVLLTAEQARGLLQLPEQMNRRQKWLACGIILLIHGGCWIFLSSKKNVSPVAYETISLSFIFGIFTVWSVLKKNGYGQALFLFGCIVFHPIYVLNGHNQLAAEKPAPTITKGMQARVSVPQFSFTRNSPVLPQKATGEDNLNPFYFDYFFMTDVLPHSRTWPLCSPAFWSYYLSRNVPENILQDYARYKFVVYDSVKVVPDDKENILPLIKGLEGKINMAFVAEDRPETKKELDAFIKNRVVSSQAIFISAASPELAVKHFTPNVVRLTTNFKNEKFLVYNDSYMKAWQAKCDGVRIPLYRANGAFKGVILAAGHHEIEFAYRPLGWSRLAGIILILYWSMFVILLIRLRKS